MCDIHETFLTSFSILMDETYTNQSWRNGEVVLNDLQILNLQRTHNEVILSCRAVNTILSTPATASVKIKMHCKYISDIDWKSTWFYLYVPILILNKLRNIFPFYIRHIGRIVENYFSMQKQGNSNEIGIFLLKMKVKGEKSCWI